MKGRLGRSGVTLLELIVVLVIMGVMASVSLVQMRSMPADQRDSSQSALRQAAVIAGTPVSSGSIRGVHAVLALPDGRVLSANGLEESVP